MASFLLISWLCQGIALCADARLPVAEAREPAPVSDSSSGPIIPAFGSSQTRSGDSEIRIFDLKEIRPGLKGFGLTVISGTSVERFDVEILGVLKNNKLSESLVITGNSILVRVDGEVITKAGGIAAGMSGSPIFVGDRLVGGLSSGWVMTDHTVGLVTPISDMLCVLDHGRGPGLSTPPGPEQRPVEPQKPQNSPPGGSKQMENPGGQGGDPSRRTLPGIGMNGMGPGQEMPGTIEWHPVEPITLDGRGVTRIIQSMNFTDPVVSSPRAEDTGGTLYFRNAAPPIVVTGLGLRAGKVLTSSPGLQNLTAVPDVFPAMPEGVGPVELKPGSAVAVQLARGDINITTLGTLTCRRGNEFIALSHSFLKRGAVDYFLSSAYIYHCFSSVDMPFKVGAPVEVVGAVTQDREQCISGRIGQFPEHIPVTVDVTDTDSGSFKSFSAHVVQDPQMLQTILMTVLSQAGESVVNRSGAGTARVSYGIVGKTVDGAHSVRRQETVYSAEDIIGKAVEGFLRDIDTLVNNEYSLFLIKELQFSMKVTAEKQVAVIKRIELGSDEVQAGRDLLVKVYIKPFRQPLRVFTKRLFLPLNFKEGEYLLMARGGSFTSDDMVDDKMSGSSSDDEVEDFIGLVEKIGGAPSASDVVVEVLSPMAAEVNRRSKKSDKPSVKAFIHLERVVEGAKEATFSVRTQ